MPVSDLHDMNCKWKKDFRNFIMMIKNYITILSLLTWFLIPVAAQVDTKDPVLKREVTLYNPYKPSLPDVKKRSYLPEVNDTVSFTPDFTYEINTTPFSPVYTISPIKSAALLSDPLPKLYKSYVNIGLGTYLTPLAEISITNERSKKGALGFYGRHYSSNGNLVLENLERVYAGYMDNDASLFGKKFFRKNFLEGSVDLIQKTRYAYGYDPLIENYEAERDSIRLGYLDIGGKVSFASLNLDSTDFSYDFDLFYDYFRNTKYLFQNHFGFTGTMARLYEGFYVGSDIAFDRYKLSDTINDKSRYVASASPFLKKSTEQWSFKLGVQVMLERDLADKTQFHLYPDVTFSFSIVPEYIRFFAGLNGRLEVNDPLKIVAENPFLVPDGSLFVLPNTDHSLIISGGLKGNNGIGGTYLASVSYSMINDMLFYSNIVHPDTASQIQRGNYFIPLPDDVDLLNFHGEMGGEISDKISFNTTANFYKYTMTANQHPWNKPSWDGSLEVKYNLRNKLIAGTSLTLLGSRKYVISESPTGWQTLIPAAIGYPVHVNLNLGAEYRYTKILSFWAKINNISLKRYMEWAFYPSQRFMIMAGFTYSL